VRARTIASRAGNAKLIVSCLQRPQLGFFAKSALAYALRPNIILVQSQRTALILNRLGIRTRFLPNGVDTGRFSPVSRLTKQRLRELYGVDDRFVVLHVGHIKEERGIRSLANAVGPNTAVILVASTSSRPDQRLMTHLVKRGVRVWSRYFENPQDIYNMVDCYFFPVRNDIASIDLPLSVLEAMSCNLPVITTRFGGLDEVFDEGQGLFFLDDDTCLEENLRMIRGGLVHIETRKKVMALSWEKIGHALDRIYDQIALEGSSTALTVS
jgi:glycosyltransferase involved in cell wall biosynthesis